VDILDEGDDFDTVFLNDNQHNVSPQARGGDIEDADVLNEIMMCISEVHKEEGQMTLDDNNSKGNSSSGSTFASPFVARTFNNMMKVKSMNVKSPKKKKGYQNLQSDDDFLFEDQSESNLTPSGEVELNSMPFTTTRDTIAPPTTTGDTTTGEHDDDEFFAAIDGFETFSAQKKERPTAAGTTYPHISSPVDVNKVSSNSPDKSSNNPFDMSLHNDDFAV